MKCRGLPRRQSGLRIQLQCMRHRRHKFEPWVEKIPWRRKWRLTSIFLPWKFNRLRNPESYSPNGLRESDMTERLSMHARQKSLNKNKVAAAKSLQSCPTLCDPIDGSPPGSRVPGILQARTLEWVAISFSNAWKWKVKMKLLSRVWLLATPWTAAYQAPPSMGFSRQEYWSGVPLPSPKIR